MCPGYKETRKRKQFCTANKTGTFPDSEKNQMRSYWDSGKKYSEVFPAPMPRASSVQSCISQQ